MTEVIVEQPGYTGSVKNYDICKDSKVDAWEDEIENDELVDKYVGKATMESVEKKIYLGQIIQNNGKNDFKKISRTK